MISIPTLLLAASAAVSGVLAAPTENGSPTLAARTASSTGTSNGFFYSFYTTSSSIATYSNGAAGEYTIEWDGTGDIVGGKGFNPGSTS
jgi:endo-1,4-beta-xylanase